MKSLREQYRNTLKTFGLSVLRFAYPLTLARPRKLLRKTPIRILVDNSVLGHSVYAENFRVDNGVVEWGELKIPRVENITQPVHDLFSEDRLAKEINYLFPISDLIKSGYIDAFTSKELTLEAVRQPHGRFFGYSRTDRSLFSDANLCSIDGYGFRPLETATEQSERLRHSENSLFASLSPFFTNKQSLDVWHLTTCERHQIPFFLTFDFKFINAFHSARERKGFPKIDVEPVAPSQLAQKYEIQPINPALLDIAHEKIEVDRFYHDPPNKRTSHRFKDEEFAEDFMTTLPRIKEVRGIRVNMSQSMLSLQYEDEKGKLCQVSMDLGNALFLLSMLKSLQLNLDIPFPDDPRDPEAPAIKPSER